MNTLGKELAMHSKKRPKHSKNNILCRKETIYVRGQGKTYIENNHQSME